MTRNQVQTEGGNASARIFGMEKAILTYEESIPPMVKLVSSNPPIEDISSI